MSKVIKEFRDKSDFAKLYRVGDEVDFDEERLAKLVKLGLVEDESSVADIDLSKMWMQVVSDVKSFADVDKLKSALENEGKSDKPRESVVKAIQE